MYSSFLELKKERKQRSFNTAINIYVPEVTVDDIIINNDPDSNTINITVNYILNLPGTSDQITIEFQ